MPDEKVLEIIVRAKDLASKTLNNISGQLEKQESKWKKMGQAIAHAGKTITITSTAIAGALASTIPAWEETRKAQIAFENTVKHMPQLVDMNVKAWYNWVSAMEMKLAVDDAEINKMASMLGTYGLTEKQMKQLIPVIVDLSRKYGIDLASATKMVGYALQGNTGLLRRYGISLDLSAAKTKEGIDANKAYELTLKQLQQAVGGFSTSLDKEGMLSMQRFQIAMGNLRETIGQVVWQTLTPFVEKLNDLIVRFNNASGPIAQFVAKVGIVGSALGLITGPLMMVIGNLGKLASTVSGLLNPWTALATAIVGLGVYLYKTNDDVKAFVDTLLADFMRVVSWVTENWGIIADTIIGVFNRIVETIQPILQPIVELIISLFGQVVSWTQENWPLIQQTISTVMNAIRTVIESVLSVIQALWKKYGDVILQNTKLIWDSIKLAISTVMNAILGIIKAIMQAINGDWEGAWNTLKETMKNVADAVVQIAKNLWAAIVNGVKAIGPELLNAVKGITQAVKDLFTNLVKQALQWGKNLIKNFIEGIKSKIKDLADAAEGAADTVGSYLGIHSPAEKGPMSDADKWMPNLITMMTSQLRAGSKAIELVARDIGNNITLPIQDRLRRLKEELEFIAKWSKPEPIRGYTPTEMIARLDKETKKKVLSDLQRAYKTLDTSTLTEFGGIRNVAGLLGYDVRDIRMVGGRNITAAEEREREQSASLANAVYQAIIRAFHDVNFAGAEKGGIVLQIDGQTFARLIFDYLVAEGKRRGVEVVPV